MATKIVKQGASALIPSATMGREGDPQSLLYYGVTEDVLKAAGLITESIREAGIVVNRLPNGLIDAMYPAEFVAYAARAQRADDEYQHRVALRRARRDKKFQRFIGAVLA